MDIKGLKTAFPILMKTRQTAFIWGSQGVGKTSVIGQIAETMGVGCIILHTATQEVGDLIGLPMKDEKTGTTFHARPSWFPTEGKGIIFLDELNRAPTDVHQALFPFVIKGELHQHKLPPGWYVVAAGNYNSDRFTVTDTSDAAWLSRFCHIDFTPSVEEWTSYAESRHMPDVADFIRAQPNMLELSSKDAGRLDRSFIVPDRRAWMEGIGKLEMEVMPDEIRYELYMGLVGPTAASAYMSFKAKGERGLSLDQILHRYPGVIRKRVQDLCNDDNQKRFDVLNQPINELFVKLDANPHLLTQTGALENLKQYLLDIPKELSMKAFSKIGTLKAFHGRNELINDPEYVKLFA